MVSDINHPTEVINIRASITGMVNARVYVASTFIYRLESKGYKHVRYNARGKDNSLRKSNVRSNVVVYTGFTGQ